LLFSAAALSALAALAGAAAWWMGPWLAAPDAEATALEKRFAVVRVIAGRASGPSRGAGKLALAAKLVQARKPGKSKDGNLPRVSDKKLSKHELDALAKLVSWEKTSGKFASSACPLEGSTKAPAPKTADAKAPVLAARAYYRLGRLALEASDRERRVPHRVHAALRLGHEMQARGDLSEYAAGLRLSVDAAQWLKSRKMEPDARFVRFRPDVASLRSALARTAVCSVDSVGDATGWGFDAKERFGNASTWPPLGLVSYRRERLVLLDFYGAVLHDTRTNRNVAEVVRTCAKRERPRSVALDDSLPDKAVFSRLAKLHTRYASLVPAKSSARKTRKPPSRSRRRQVPRRQRSK
jgi:hypothetical protein